MENKKLMKDSLSHKILKQLTFEFKETGDNKIFLKILSRIDNLIVFTVNNYIRRRPQYYNKNIAQDFYHSAIIGVYRAIGTAKESESGRKLQARYIAYMKAQIRNFCDNPQEWKIINSVYGSKDLIVPEETVYHDLEVEFLRERFIKLITDDIITPTELNLIYLKFVAGVKMQTLVGIYGKSAHLIRKQIKSIVKRIRTSLCARNLEEE
jgi:hypothetical protein